MQGSGANCCNSDNLSSMVDHIVRSVTSLPPLYMTQEIDKAIIHPWAFYDIVVSTNR